MSCNFMSSIFRSCIFTSPDFAGPPFSRPAFSVAPLTYEIKRLKVKGQMSHNVLVAKVVVVQEMCKIMSN